MINPIIFAGLLLMAATPAFAAPQCWFDGFQMQCGYPQARRPWFEERREWRPDRERHEERRERHEDRR